MEMHQAHRDGAIAQLLSPQAVTPPAVLKAVGVGRAAALVAGSVVLIHPGYDIAALSPGNGHAYDPWYQWRANTSTLGVVAEAAALLAAPPHNIQPWTFRVTDTNIDQYADATPSIGTGTGSVETR